MAQAECGEGKDGSVMRHEVAEQLGKPVQRAQLTNGERGERQPGEGLQAAGEAGLHR